ncbi:MAG: hypothetical protein WEK74_03590 [Hydrogenophaga sp.]
MITVQAHCSSSENAPDRCAGRWIYQLAVDTIAFAQNIPLRILLVPTNLQDLFDHNREWAAVMAGEKPTFFTDLLIHLIGRELFAETM